MCALCTCLRWKKVLGFGLQLATCAWELRLNQRYSVHMFFSQCRIGNEKWRNYNQTNFRVHHSIWTNCTRNVYQNRIKIGHQPQRVHVNHYHHQSVKLNLLVKTAGVRMGGREGGPISGFMSVSPWRYMLRWLAPKRRLLQWPLGQASAVEIYI